MKKIAIFALLMVFGQAQAMFKVDAGSFSAGASIPVDYVKSGCVTSLGQSGRNLMPTITLSNVPQGTQSFALIMDDPDGTDIRGNPWVHWVLFNIPANTSVISPETVNNLPGAVFGVNSWGTHAYNGPCPPAGDKPHTYYITIYALDTVLNLGGNATRADVFAAMQGRILAQAVALGSFGI